MPDVVARTIRPLLTRLHARGSPAPDDIFTGPIRGDLLGSDQLAAKARDVARDQRLSTTRRRPSRAPLLTRLHETRRILEGIHTRLAASAQADFDIGPAGDWLLDNFHVVREHIREVDETLPRGFYRELPMLSSGLLAGYPRVYELAITLISHTEARIDEENLGLFVAAFQEHAPLSIGELWALPAMFRLALIESVRRMALRTAERMDEIRRADEWAERLEIAGEKGTQPVRSTLESFVRAPPRLTPVFVSRFVHQVRLSRRPNPSLVQVERWMAERALGAEEATSRATQHLALTQVIVANSVTSLRTIAHLNWAAFVEDQSIMERVLKEDPSGFYGRMTFATRDQYRHAVERIAKGTGSREEDVARLVIERARSEIVDGGAPQLRAHIGYHIVDDGLPSFEVAAGYRPQPGEVARRWVLRNPDLVLSAGIIGWTLAALAAVLWLSGSDGWTVWPVVLLLALIPAGELAISSVNQLITIFLHPRLLPKLDLRGEEGIPAEFRTAVVIPTLFARVEAVEEALSSLEVQFLANRESHLHFAVLSDFPDAPDETEAGDAAIVEAAATGVRELNARYGEGRNDLFYLFHRPRRWNAQQGVWMGWERKRGKLAEFNRFLRDGTTDAFSGLVGDVEPLRAVRYVITLDADTVLPPGAARDLVGALAHPLNRAVFDPALGRVVRGYGILQPQVGVSLPSAYASRFAALHSGHPGVDPYTTAASDVYQDLYGEGSFTGKGIYDVDAFKEATRGRFPENTLLSHDLIEGSYARAGLATEIRVYDDYPSRYLTFSKRKHRWIRGDWQLLGWLTRRVPGPDGPEPNRLRLLSKWKILDNLRRSTVEIGRLLFLVAGWTILPGSPVRWTVLGLGMLIAPWVVSLLLDVLRPPLDKSWRAYYAAVAQDAIIGARQAGLAIAVLPHQAWISADAILRTLWRLFVSRRRLLEWQTASGVEHSVSGTAASVWLAMSPAVGIAGALGIVATIGVLGGRISFWDAAIGIAPILGVWLASPAIAHALSAPALVGPRPLSSRQKGDALRLALLHWRFFDRFVGPETQWLAPDNFQEDPAPALALRTSPTNIGLQLLSIVSACDLGFITEEEMTRRLELAFSSLEEMGLYRGHFFNWYDLRDLSVLEPAYVSTVDSGNLAGHLVALRQACQRMPAPTWGVTQGDAALRVAVDLAGERLEALQGTATPLPWKRLESVREHLQRARRALDPENGPAKTTRDELGACLRTALDALGSAGLPPEQRNPIEEWIAWSLARTTARLTEESVDRVDLTARLDRIAERAHRYVENMDFGFLFDDDRDLFSIGYQVGARSLDPSYYDLLASESRLASFVAIAKKEVPVEHWFRLGRGLTRSAGETALVSWSGSMFEYLMPALVMRSFPLTVLDHTHRAAVRRQIAYGRERGTPWGVSESAYNHRDRHLTYQYRAFGVPGLALKRGLGRDLVIAPYASILAMMVAPNRALGNFATLEGKGALGPYGFRDALDYTRPDAWRAYAVVGTYMAHHVGMSLVAIANVLDDQVWHDRFHSDPLVRSAELLLHERIPRRLVVQKTQRTVADEIPSVADVESPAVREFDRVDTPSPHIALLGRVPYTVMISHCGSGHSRYDELAVTRWRSDGTTDSTGQYCYVKDVSGGRAWSVAHQPLCAPADWYRALLATDRVTFHRSDGGIETRTEIAVVPEDAAEVRCVTVTNHTREAREIELTSYGEVVLGPPDADRAHPAFANLFVETEWHGWCSAITATRRPRSATDIPLWCVHVVNTGPERVGEVSYETDRALFLGRGSTPRDPVALAVDGPLSCSSGAVLDPIFALRTRVLLEPGQSASVAFTTLVARTRERAFELASRYHDAHSAQRALDLAWTSQQVELRELDVTPTDAAVFQELAGYVFYPRAELRAPASELLRNEGTQQLLWSIGVSGDWPIVLATIDGDEGLPTLRQLLTAHHYWRRRGLTIDLVVLNSQPSSSYFQELDQGIQDAMFAASETEIEKPGGVFMRRTEALTGDEMLMLRATARLLVRCNGRPLAWLLDSDLKTPAEPTDPAEPDGDRGLASKPRPLEQHSQPAAEGGRRVREASIAETQAADASPHFAARSLDVTPSLDTGATSEPAVLLFDNGYGGLTASGSYQIRVRGELVPPAPWANVVANPYGGFVVTERGGGFTWAGNSYFFRLTPWSNDPVSDPVAEVLYLHDEDDGELWCPTPAPIHQDAAYTVLHGAGTSVFEFEHRGIATKLTLGMAEGEAVKLSILRVHNRDDRVRRIGVTAYVEWTLGVHRENTQHQVHTSFAPELGAILARNFFDEQFAGEVAFCALSESITGHTADRREFLGRNGSVSAPAALLTGELSGAVGAGFDPCATLQCGLVLQPGESKEILLVLGATSGEDAARATVARYRHPRDASTAVEISSEAWERRLSVVSVRTPEPSFDAMLNRWALYQALSSRMWARSSIYQSSGAYGFRDQLQDVLAFVYAEPAIAREHILRAAARQFVEGDVQHWWHPQSGRGVRTRFSDDLAWLPFVVDGYITVTGDASVLDEVVPFLKMRVLEPDEDEVYDLPAVSEERGSVYEHCLRALRRAATAGVHGLPLIGVGDWNDGMNRVGIEGRGESVWLAWFLIANLRQFAAHASERGDATVAAECAARADAYVTAVEAHGWDGDWYRRAYFDDGSPLGSRGSDECQIDSIAQSWSIISGAGRPDRQTRALQSFEEHLVDSDERILMLLTPPFDETPRDPGYIKGYLPGVRENGAQYTHAALWGVLATAMSGNGERAFELVQMINPLTHARSQEEAERYKVEPYVVAADVYTAPGQLGRGGWTWYTGSASWMYRVGLEAILGFHKRGDTLRIDPRVPASWPEYSIDYRFGDSLYSIVVQSPGDLVGGRMEILLDDLPVDGPDIPLRDDGSSHRVVVRPRLAEA